MKKYYVSNLLLQTAGIQLYTDVVGFEFAKRNYRRQVDCDFSFGGFSGGSGSFGSFEGLGDFGGWGTFLPGMMPTPAPGMTYRPATAWPFDFSGGDESDGDDLSNY